MGERWGVRKSIKHMAVWRKEVRKKQIGVMRVRNFQTQITCNKILSHSCNLCVLRQFDVTG